jgi:glycosyltransferase involved in cell wall biosynthesis
MEGHNLNRPTVSVIVAFYNGSRWIERALESVVNQTIPADEVIVVDDGSSQEESDFLRNLASTYSFKIVSQPNSGQSTARNRGVEESNSDYFCLLDQDDYFLPGHIEQLIKAADVNDPNFAFSYGDLWRVNEAGQVLTHTCVNLESQHPHKRVETLISTNMFILPSASLIKRDVFLRMGGFDPRLRGYEDDDFFIRLFVAGYSNRFTPEAVTVWTLNKTSTSFTESMARSRFVYFKKLCEMFPEGSLVGVRVFGDLLFRRFGLQFAHDVIASAFNEGLDYEERQSRLIHFRSLVVASNEVPARTRVRFLTATYPMVKFGHRFLRILLLFLLRSGALVFLRGIPGQADFVRKYLPRKKPITR